MKKQTGNVLIIVLILLFICNLVITTQLSKLIIQEKTSQFFYRAVS